MKGAHSRRARRTAADVLPGWPVAPVLALLAGMLLVTGAGPAAWRTLQPDLRHRVPKPFTSTSTPAAAVTAANAVRTGPPSLRLVVVPPVPDFVFRVGGRTVVTGADGSVRVDGMTGRVAVQAVGYSVSPSFQLVQSRRWSDGSTIMRRSVEVRGTTNLALGVDVSHRVTVTAERPDGASRAEVDIELRSRAGPASLRTGRTTWLLAQRAVAEGSSLVPEELTYSVESARSGARRLHVESGTLDPIPEALWVVRLA